jgi:hypothetical protein
MGVRRDALIWLAALAAGWSEPAMAQAANPRAVTTYESAGFYWTNPPGNPTAGCAVRYRRVGESTWKAGLTLWFDSRNNECRGSLVGLAAGTDYEAELSVTSPSQVRPVAFRTWANQKPVKQIIAVLPGNATLDVSKGGNAAEGYVVYQVVPSGAVIDVANSAPYNVTINASYVIVRGLTLRGAQQHGILISPAATDVVIEDNEITGWGRQRIGSAFGTDLDSAIRAICPSPTLERVTIQRNDIHHPRYGANSWTAGHPAGPQAITFSSCGGNHVIRHNEIHSAAGNYYYDIIGGEDNFSTVGFPNADSDIYGNELSHAWDDGIEAEGGNRNVRIWGNYLDSTATGIATTVTATGPVYLFRNVWNRNRFYEGTAADSDDRQPFFKSGSDATLGHGRRFIFHNTMLQTPPPAGSTYPLGGGAGISGTGTAQLVQNTFSKNNVFQIWKEWWTVYYQAAASGNSFERDLYNGVAGATVTNGINAAPVYQSGNGPASEAGGQYALAPASRGFDEGVRINNFNDDFLGAAPDIGAHEAGAPAMRFGIAASPGSAVPAQPMPVLTGAVSRKAHGSAGTFDFGIDVTRPVTGAVTAETRQGPGHKLVFTFSTAIWYPGTVACVDALGTPIGSATATAVGSTVEISLGAIPDIRRVNVTLSNINNSSVNASVALGLLVGDANGSLTVTASDILRAKGRVGQALSAANFIYDVDANGAIDANDVEAIKGRSGTEL